MGQCKSTPDTATTSRTTPRRNVTGGRSGKPPENGNVKTQKRSDAEQMKYLFLLILTGCSSGPQPVRSPAIDPNSWYQQHGLRLVPSEPIMGEWWNMKVVKEEE